MEKVFNKLVRNRIPEMIENNCEVPVTRVLEDKEYKEELHKKLKEEVNEVIGAETHDEIIEELADVFEVMRALVELEGSSIDEVKEIAENKRIKRGGFEKRIYLEKKMIPDVEG